MDDKIMIEKPIIETNRLTLRPFIINDLRTMHEYASDIENTKYMIHLPNYEIRETEQFLTKVIAEWQKEIPSFFEFAIIHDNEHIGAVSIYFDENKQEGELGWIINKNYHNNGYATEAAKAVLDFAINNFQVNKIIAHCDYRNTPSCRVMQKIGLSLERDDGLRYYQDGRDNNEPIKELMFSLVF